MERKNTVFLTIIAIATLLVAVIGATFAYFSVIITGNDTATSTVIRTANIKITYTAGDSINLENVEPGVNGDMTFTVANDGDRALEYKVKWTNVTNTFPSTIDGVAGNNDELTYTVNAVSGADSIATLAATAAPTADGYINLNSGNPITIAAGATHSYTIHMEFVETSSEQNYNQGRTFSAAVEVELAGNTYYSTDNVYSGN